MVDGGLLPQLWPHGALGDATVCALSSGCTAAHTMFITGTPPAEPGFDAPLAAHASWLRRRTLLMCLLNAAQAQQRTEGAPPTPAAAENSSVLLRVAELPEELWMGPAIFQFL